MLLRSDIAKAVAAGRISTVYRRWERLRIRPGSTFRTIAGVLEVVSVRPTPISALTSAAAKAAGYPSRAALRRELDRFRGTVYRIALRYRGEDPRAGLRARSKLTAAEVRELEDRILRLGARTAAGPWALDVLRSIRDRPGTRAADLARRHGVERTRFKARVRQLKELGLTESLETGYRLSARGKALLRRLEG